MPIVDLPPWPYDGAPATVIPDPVVVVPGTSPFNLLGTVNPPPEYVPPSALVFAAHVADRALFDADNHPQQVKARQLIQEQLDYVPPPPPVPVPH